MRDGPADMSANVVTVRMDDPLSGEPGEYRQITVGVLDDDSRYAFTQGHCQLLAFALHWRTGWPLVSAGRWENGEFIPGRHFGVRTPDGRVLDVEGPHEIHAWAGRWGIDGAFGEVDLWPSRDATVPDPGLLNDQLDEVRAESFVDPVLRLLDGPDGPVVLIRDVPACDAPACDAPATRWSFCDTHLERHFDERFTERIRKAAAEAERQPAADSQH